jgi:programmed cell death 6-interacting protein
MASEDKFKEAALYFLTSAWLFDRIKTESVALTPGELTLDFTEQNLLMTGYLMRAQAQTCAHEKIKRKSKQYPILSKLALQTAIYYGKAYSLASTPPLSTRIDKRDVAAVLLFNEYAYTAHAYNWAAMEWQEHAEKNGKGMGKALLNIRKAVEYLENYSKQEKTPASAIQITLKDMLQRLQKKKSELEEKNARVYFEALPPQLDEIVPLPYNQPVSLDELLNRPFEGQQVFVHLAPPVVRVFEAEYKEQIAALINETFEFTQQCVAQQDAFFAKYDLPTCLHAASGDQALPEDLWTKVKVCKEKGGENGLRRAMEEAKAACEKNIETIERLTTQLREEDEVDQGMRKRHGAAWNRPQSQQLCLPLYNQITAYRKQIEEQKQKLALIHSRMIPAHDALSYLDLEKDALAAEMPQSRHGSGKLSIAATTYELL